MAIKYRPGLQILHPFFFSPSPRNMIHLHRRCWEWLSAYAPPHMWERLRWHRSYSGISRRYDLQCDSASSNPENTVQIILGLRIMKLLSAILYSSVTCCIEKQRLQSPHHAPQTWCLLFLQCKWWVESRVPEVIIYLSTQDACELCGGCVAELLQLSSCLFTWSLLLDHY